MRDELELTVVSLCQWIRERAENGCSGEELARLPEVIQATTALIDMTVTKVDG